MRGSGHKLECEKFQLNTGKRLTGNMVETLELET